MIFPTMDVNYFISRSKQNAANAKPGPERTYRCERCQDTGVLARWEEQRRFVEPCQCRRREREVQRLKNSGLPEYLVGKCTFDSFRVSYPVQERMKAAAMAYVLKPEGWLLLAGQNGCGKTHLAIAAAAELLGKGMDVCYMSWRGEITELKRLDADRTYRSGRIARLHSCALLLIDDLLQTSGALREVDLNLAFEILEARYNAALPTILTTQWRVGDIAAGCEPLGSRIMELTNGRRVVVDNDKKYDMRLLRT